MQRFALSLALLLFAASAYAQGGAPSPYYPAPPPEQAPKVEQGAPLTNLSSPLDQDLQKITNTIIDSDTEAQLFASAAKIVWGRYAKLKGAKPGEVTVSKDGAVWRVKGRLDSVAPGTEGDWTSINGVVERISPGTVQIRGEVAFRVAKVMNGTPCKVGGTLHFKRSGKSQVWRLAEGDNPCDGAQEMFDLVYEKQVEKKPADKKPLPTQPKKG
jgi:hypothetical protein